MIHRSTTVQDTRNLGAQVARIAQEGDVFGLVGDLGAGKTEFVRGFVGALEPGATVRSPTFSLVNTYATPGFPVHHFDFYRLRDESELVEVGFAEYLGGDGVCVIEWADMFYGVLPAYTHVIRFSEGDGGQRQIDMGDVVPGGG